MATGDHWEPTVQEDPETLAGEFFARPRRYDPVDWFLPGIVRGFGVPKAEALAPGGRQER